MGDAAPVAGDGGDGTRSKGWRKSSYSMTNGHCLEVACLAGGRVAARDSQAASGLVLSVESGAWAAFVAGLRRR